MPVNTNPFLSFYVDILSYGLIKVRSWVCLMYGSDLEIWYGEINGGIKHDLLLLLGLGFN